MAKRGRPTKLTPAIWDEIIRALKAGMLLHDAAEFAGISRDTLSRWMKKGERSADEADEYRQFSDAVAKARSAAKLRAVGAVHAHMTKHWKAAAWWLSVTDPRNYGPKVRVTLEQEFSRALARISKRVSTDVYEQVLDAILEDDGAPRESEAGESEELKH
jgi:hypothetical protein